MEPDKKQQSRAAFDQQAATYDTAIQGSHARALYPYLLQEITHAWGDRVLDLGCGTGALMAQVLSEDGHRRVTGLDLSEGMLAQARVRLGDRADLVQGDSSAGNRSEDQLLPLSFLRCFIHNSIPPHSVGCTAFAIIVQPFALTI